MGDLPLRTPRHRCLGKPLPYQLANVTHDHLLPPKLYLIIHANHQDYRVLIQISLGYPLVKGRFHTRYAPVRRSSSVASYNVTPRLACVRPVASVHPEPGSNSSLYKNYYDCFNSLLFFTRVLTQRITLSFLVCISIFSKNDVSLITNFFISFKPKLNFQSFFTPHPLLSVALKADAKITTLIPILQMFFEKNFNYFFKPFSKLKHLFSSFSKTYFLQENNPCALL